MVSHSMGPWTLVKCEPGELYNVVRQAKLALAPGESATFEHALGDDGRATSRALSKAIDKARELNQGVIDDANAEIDRLATSSALQFAELSEVKAKLADANTAAGPAIREWKAKWEAVSQELGAVKRALEEQEERERKRFEAEGFDPDVQDWEQWAFAAYQRASDQKCLSVEVALVTFKGLADHLASAVGTEKLKADLEDHNELAADQIERQNQELEDLRKERDEALFHIARMVLRDVKRPRRTVSLHRTPAEEAPDETPPEVAVAKAIKVRHTFKGASLTAECEVCGGDYSSALHDDLPF